MKTIKYRIKLSHDFNSLDDMFESFKHEGFIQECFNTCSNITDLIRKNRHVLEPGAKSVFSMILEGIKDHPLVANMDQQRKVMLYDYVKQVLKELDKCKVVFTP